MLAAILTRLYRGLPISMEKKLQIKGSLFQRFPRLFRHMPAYQNWHRHVEGRSHLPDGYERVAAPAKPTGEKWAALDTPRHRRAHDHADPSAPFVVVPVYDGLEETLACLYSVVASMPALRFELVVIYDAGPNPVLLDALRDLAGQKFFTLLENARNGGFVTTANRGMAYDESRDVVLLNSDTEVYGDWLDRLRDACHGAEDIATVTPLTNNGEIASFPFWLTNNDQALEIDHAELDDAARRVNARATVDAPTGVGFCLYIRRAALSAVGLFDAEAFPRGYGEENDLCRRFVAQGWRNVIAGDIFVRHFGAVSFGATKAALSRRAGQTVERRHPGYHDLIQRFIRADDVRALRIRLDAARWQRYLRALGRGAETRLFVVHGLDGGTIRHAEHLAERLIAEGCNVVFMLPDPTEPRHVGLYCAGGEAGNERAAGARVALNGPGVPVTPNLQKIDIDRDTAALVDALGILEVSAVHVHHILGYGPGAGVWFADLQARLGIGFDITLHDYAAICPRVHCGDGTGRFCGLPAPRACETCIRTNGTTADTPSAWLWREQFRGLLKGARRIIAPSDGLARTIEAYYPELRVQVRPHPENVDGLPFAADRARGQTPRHIVLLGAIGPHKGYDLLLAMARDAQRRRLPLRFTVVGYSSDDSRLRHAGVSVTGPYERDSLPSRIQELRPDAALFLSVVPESYCFTLSEALALGLFPIALDLGAIGDRLRDLGWGALWPLTVADDPAALNDRLLATTCTPAPTDVAERAWVPAYPTIRDHYYGTQVGAQLRAIEG